MNPFLFAGPRLNNELEQLVVRHPDGSHTYGAPESFLNLKPGDEVVEAYRFMAHGGGIKHTQVWEKGGGWVPFRRADMSQEEILNSLVFVEG